MYTTEPSLPKVVVGTTPVYDIADTGIGYDDDGDDDDIETE